MASPPKRAVVLLSGGLDSSTTLAIARREGFECHALSFSYGQTHADELKAATRIAGELGAVAHRAISIDLTVFGGSALTDRALQIPKDGALDPQVIPITYVPARNTIFLSYALAWAEVLECFNIFIGVSSVDYSGYPDCRPEYIEAFERMANLATRAGVEGHRMTIHTPIIHLSKAQTILRGLELGVDYALTHSCYAPEDGRACGRCDSCVLRRRGFDEAGVADPTVYAFKE